MTDKHCSPVALISLIRSIKLWVKMLALSSIISRIISRFKNEVIYGGHITALIGPSLVLISIIILELPLNYYSLMVAYLIPLLVYSYNYQKELDIDEMTNSDKTHYLYERNRVFPLLFYTYLILTVVLSIMINSLSFLLFLAIIFTGGILYTVIFKRLASIVPAFKNIFSTAVWAYSGTFFNIFLYSLTLDAMFLFLFIFIYIKILINNIFFDIKDIATDKNEGLMTIPILLGKKNTYYFLTFLNLAALILLIYSVYTNVVPLYTLSLGIFFPYTQYYLIKGNTTAGKDLLNYTYIMSDAEFIFWPIALFMGKIIMNVMIF
ncbi:UbiA family prenyltransferase [Methanocella arvoryzae]|uniref:Prenyltransferase (UbiA family) n=1 Tax=Methanocella arvoryzae (strain DSM 22066 / NBRC 105507 / MRE50) TaxID=351160 RepID=Q0W8D7_METAR|nr:UbiA family prenyltransferase [Methanocella arvoryzae]CAJ35356.1 putative prenyltransferase (UbiA family) [Methanocella arvoryzae MRE50]